MKLHKDKCQFLPLQGTNPGNGIGWGAAWLGSSPVEKVLVVMNLDRRQPCALKQGRLTTSQVV